LATELTYIFTWSLQRVGSDFSYPVCGIFFMLANILV
jgi:hypothetical protein